MSSVPTPSPPRTPRVPGPPHEPTSLLLNGRVGWRAAALFGLLPDPGSAALRLAPRPEEARTLTEGSGSFGGLRPPANVAVGRDGSVYLLDALGLTLKRFDPCTCTFEVMPGIGGRGGGERQWRNPNGIGIRGRDLYVCDTGESAPGPADPGEDPAGLHARRRLENHRVSVFALKGLALRGHLRPPPAVIPAWAPCGIAFDTRGQVFVTDTANALVHRFDAAGHWQAALAGFAAPTRIAIDRRDRLYVIEPGPPPSVRVLDGLGNPVTGADAGLDPLQLAPWFEPPAFGVEATGTIDLSALCLPGAATGPEAPMPPGRGRFDAQGNPLDPQTPLPAPPQVTASGLYTSLPLDSRTYRCTWHRVVLHATLPTGTRILVRTFTAETPYSDAQVADLADWQTGQRARGPVQGDWDCLVRSDPGRYLWLQLQFEGQGAATPRLDAIEIEFPRLGSLRYLPAVFAAEPIGADFTARLLALFDTTLGGIERTLDQAAGLFDPLSAPAAGDPGGRGDFLSWLAGWVGVAFDRNWDLPKRRRFLKRAGRLLERRGTLAGLREQLLILLEFDQVQPCCLGPGPHPHDHDAPPSARWAAGADPGWARSHRDGPVTCACPPDNCAPRAPAPAFSLPPLVLEHFRLRRWLFVGRGRLGEQAMLWGTAVVNRSQLDENAQVGCTRLLGTPDPLHDPFLVYAHRYTVFVPARYRDHERDRKALENLLRSESPAHTSWTLRFVEPRFRIGVQSMIGFDSVIGRVPQGVTLGQGALGQGTVLTAAPALQGGPAIALGKEGRIGTTMLQN